MTSRHAFTLLEVLLAASITALLAALLLAVVSQVLDSSARVSGRLSARGQAEFVLDRLAADLEAAMVRFDEGVSFAATIQREQTGSGDSGMAGVDWAAQTKPRGTESLRLTPVSDDPAGMRFGQAGVWLRFFTIAPESNADASSRSAPRAVAYQLVRRRSGERYAYQFFRADVRPGGTDPSTFSTGYDLFAPAYTTPNGSARHPGNVRRPNAAFLLGNHVVDFGVRIHVRAIDGTLECVFPDGNDAGQSFLATADPDVEPAGYAGRPVVRGVPAVVDLMVRVLDGEGAQQIANLEAGLSTPPDGMTRDAFWWRLVDEHAHVALRRVVLVSEPR